MAYYEGETLREKIERGPLPVAEVIDYARQLGNGLARAHEAGIVHRDVKPGNVIVTPRGRAVILDFGIAKVEDATRTETHGVPGTVGYMSPEQTRGGAVDPRTDLWSLGVVLYECLTGARPFRGDRLEAVVHAIRHDTPTPVTDLRPDVPKTLAKAIKKLLDKDIDTRCPSGNAFVEDLTGAAKGNKEGRRPSSPGQPSNRLKFWLRLTAPHARHIRSGGIGVALLGLFMLLFLLINREATAPEGKVQANGIAVLPFYNMSREAENEYFSDGITEELIHALAQIEGLRVAGRTSSFFFKGKKLTLKDIGRQLQVAYVVDGSVRNINDRMLISVQLVSVDDGSTLWSRIYDPARGNLLSVQQDMASTIADTLAVLLGVRITPPLVRRVATNDASYHRYLKGRYFFNQRSAEGLAKALDYFEEAILLDPDNALAHASIVHAYAPLIAVGSVDFNGVQPRLKRAVEAALALDSTLSEVYTALAWYKSFQWEWLAVEEALQKAVAHNPNDASAHQWYGLHLGRMGREDANVRERERAVALDPLSAVLRTSLGDAHQQAGLYGQAREQYLEAIELRPDYWMAHGQLGALYVVQGRYEEALASCRKAASYAGGGGLALSQACMAYVLAKTGREAQALAILKTLMDAETGSSRYPMEVALVYVGLEDHDQAFAWLDEAYERRYYPVTFVRSYQLFKPLHEDPRFFAFLRKAGLEAHEGEEAYLDGDKGRPREM